MANKHATLSELFNSTADAIRAKTGSVDAIVADNFPDEIAKIKTGGVELPSLSNPASAGHILKSREAIDAYGNKIVGTLETETLEDMTADADASASDIMSGKTAYVDGQKVTGSYVPKTLTELTVDANATSEDIAKGKTAYVDGNKVTGTYEPPTLASLTDDATAGSGDILTGKTAYVDGSKVEGTMPNNGAVSSALAAGGSYTIPAGYHNGNGKVTANSLASQTAANAAAGDIANGKTAWVNGQKVTGTLVASAANKKCVGTITLSENLGGIGVGSIASHNIQNTNGKKFTGMDELVAGDILVGVSKAVCASFGGNLAYFVIGKAIGENTYLSKGDKFDVYR